MVKTPIRVYLVEDSAIARTILKDILNQTPDLEVIGSASNGATALIEIPQLQPDVVCTDLNMPRMDGLELIQKLLASFPRPILVLSEAVQPGDTDTIDQLINAGALAVIAKTPAALRADDPNLRQALENQLKLIAGVTVLTKSQRQTAKYSRDRGAAPEPAPVSSPSVAPQRYAIIAIGASTGGPQAVHQVIQTLPPDFPLPILCTQHISKGFLPGLVSWQNAHCRLQVKIAEARETPQGGYVYYAPDDVHLILDSQGRLAFSDAPPIDKHRPSISTMFGAIAEYYGRQAVGILLTGMGKDGAQGLQRIARSGGLTIAQDESSSVVFGMPKVAIDIGASQHVLPPDKISAFLKTLLN